MKEISLKQEFIKNISLAKNAGVKYDEPLSQNELAVTPNGLNWLFLRPNTAKAGIGVSVSPSYMQTLPMLANFRPFMVWLILQNKPFGEYVKRLLIQPRVRPHRPFMGFLLKIELGASIMTANPILSHSTKSLAKSHEFGNNTATTKRKAVKPNRHSLAIFTPTVSNNSTTGVNASSQDKHAPSWVIRALSSVFGGLIGVNTKPKGNSPSRLFAVVETRHPICGVVSLTKRKGTPTVNNTVIHHSLTVLADEYHLYNALHADNPYAGHADRANAIYNAMNELVKLMNAQDGANVPAKPKTITERIKRYLARLQAIFLLLGVCNDSY
ncbi:hypothetical protein G5C01_06440 [Moraxella bovoculi]|uniref:hypothetical protein n=1 Tax=Moraxella bovoculi TaxID=386891 RepID=UPI001570C5E1|nr:hypothetical protein [Moraxella bovoculi]NSM10993.1 hypothetical protein [Moraxella bovoculi]